MDETIEKHFDRLRRRNPNRQIAMWGEEKKRSPREEYELEKQMRQLEGHLGHDVGFIKVNQQGARP